MPTWRETNFEPKEFLVDPVEPTPAPEEKAEPALLRESDPMRSQLNEALWRLVTR
jgi:hypothetical protein